MALFRAPAIRNLISGTSPYVRASQRRWAQVHDVRFLATQQSERILDKYKEKLAQKAKQEGLKDINELKDAYKEKIDDLKKKATIEIPTPNSASPSLESSLTTTSSPFPPPPPPPSPARKTGSSSAIKTLNSYLGLEKARELPAKEIEAIWRLRHTSSPLSLCATIPVPIYNTIEKTAKKFPTFILPLPRPAPDLTEIHFLQWTFPAPDTVVVLFTHLAEFKVRGEYAEPHTVITHHLELAEDKNIVLMKGEVMKGKGITVEEAQWLILCLQRFYGEQGQDVARKALLEGFSRGDGNFKVEDLVEEAEKIV